MFVLLCLGSALDSAPFSFFRQSNDSDEDHYRPERFTWASPLLPPEEREVGLIFQSSISGAEKNTTLRVYEAHYALLPHRVTLGTGPRFVLLYLSSSLDRSQRLVPVGYRVLQEGPGRVSLLEREQ